MLEEGAPSHFPSATPLPPLGPSNNIQDVLSFPGTACMPLAARKANPAGREGVEASTTYHHSPPQLGFVSPPYPKPSVFWGRVSDPSSAPSHRKL